MTLITLMPWGDAVYVRRARNQKWGVNGNEVGIVYVRGVRVELWEVYVGVCVSLMFVRRGWFQLKSDLEPLHAAEDGQREEKDGR